MGMAADMSADAENRVKIYWEKRIREAYEERDWKNIGKILDEMKATEYYE